MCGLRVFVLGRLSIVLLNFGHTELSTPAKLHPGQTPSRQKADPTAPMAFCAIFLFIALRVVAQFVPAPTDLIPVIGDSGILVRYKQVPSGICEQNPNVKSYTGYVDVAEDQHIFFWFVEGRHNPLDAPLTVWLNGGPGASSMYGLFEENGPCRIQNNHPVDNPYSWSNLSNMLYIDQPTQTGFSYSIPVPGFFLPKHGLQPLDNNSCPDWVTELDGRCGTFSYPNATLTAHDTCAAAPAFRDTLQGFMDAFPQYARKKINLATESYGGHYGPAFAEYLKNQSTRNLIDVDTILIGNGWIDSWEAYQAHYNYTIFPGNPYGVSPFNKSTEALMYNLLWGKGNCGDQLRACKATDNEQICGTADTFCTRTQAIYLDSNRSYYDIRLLGSDPLDDSHLVDYLNTLDVLSAIGAYQNYSTSSHGPIFSSRIDFPSATNMIQRLHHQGVNIVLYYGDADFLCNWIGGQSVADEIDAPGYREAGYQNLSTSDGVVHGRVRQSARFAWVQIYNASHSVPSQNGEIALQLFGRAISGKDLATGNETVQFEGPCGSQYNTNVLVVFFRVFVFACVIVLLLYLLGRTIASTDRRASDERRTIVAHASDG